ncbi:Putative transcriptional regulator (fragment) [groundwater metagenome]|uniref:Putative transcriptional regulator n=1 Tax=groundwater metagenome TaxID=717931 RepID=A0A098E6L3_9ZZZZ
MITGRRIPKIRKGMKSNGSPEPIFETDDERTYFLTTLMIHPEATISEQENPQVSEHVSEQTIQILDFYKISRKKQEILNHIGLSTFYLNYKRYILPLIKKGFLSMTHPENPRHRDQKYVITNNGLKNMR